MNAFKCVPCKKKKKRSSAGKLFQLLCNQNHANMVMICKYHRYIFREGVIWKRIFNRGGVMRWRSYMGEGLHDRQGHVGVMGT